MSYVIIIINLIIKELKSDFDEYDVDGNGKITVKEYREYWSIDGREYWITEDNFWKEIKVFFIIFECF